MEISASKLHGLGNAYVVIEDLARKLEKRYPEIAKGISNMSFGIGSDGILVVNRGKLARYRMRVFNPDGGEAEMSGNGARIFAIYLYDRKMISRKAEIEVGGRKGGKLISVAVEGRNHVTVDFGKGMIIGSKSVVAKGKRFSGTHVDVGNPHFIIFDGSDDAARVHAKEYGNAIERHAAFKPNGVNVEFAHVRNRHNITLHVWERGTGITLACGSGACATALAARKKGLIADKVSIRLLGGTLTVLLDDDRIVLKGPVGHIFSGKLYLDEILEGMV